MKKVFFWIKFWRIYSYKIRPVILLYYIMCITCYVKHLFSCKDDVLNATRLWHASGKNVLLLAWWGYRPHTISRLCSPSFNITSFFFSNTFLFLSFSFLSRSRFLSFFLFMSPEWVMVKVRGHLVCVLSVCLAVCLSVTLSSAKHL